MKIHPNDEILEISYHGKIEKYEKSAAKDFKAILKEAVESSPKVDAQDQRPPINTISEIQTNTFCLGEREPVGKILSVQGKVRIIHKDMARDYWAKKDLPLHKGDSIITQEKSQVRFKLNDGSIMTMGSRTKLVLNRSVYDPKKKTRSSFFEMSLGKARFWLKKLFYLRLSESKVKTPTAVMGVRGSDFIIKATPKLTEVTALKDTLLEVASLAFPEVKPVVVTDFQRTIVEKGSLPTEVEMVPPEEIEELKKEFTVTPETVVS
jgi:hypothetical protein